jgi:hypothetical protein
MLDVPLVGYREDLRSLRNRWLEGIGEPSAHGVPRDVYRIRERLVSGLGANSRRHRRSLARISCRRYCEMFC